MRQPIQPALFNRNFGDIARSFADRISPHLFFNVSRVVRDLGNLVPHCIVATEPGKSGTLLYSGFSKRKASYWINHFTGCGAERLDLGRCWCTGACRRSRRVGARPDIAVFEESAVAGAIVKHPSSFRVPEWVDMVTDLSEGPDRIKKFKTGVRKARENGLRLSTGRSNAKLDFFYRRMYVPYTLVRHSDRAFLYSKASFEKDLAVSELYLLNAPEGAVAGFFVVYESHRRAYLRAMGINDRSGECLQWGLSDALYALTFAELHQRGFTEVSMGGVRPFLNDGLMRYKMAWGGIPAATVHHVTDYFRLVACRSSPAAYRYLAAAPFWHVDQAGRLKLACINGPGAVKNVCMQRPGSNVMDEAVALCMDDCLCGKRCDGPA
jgi:hypothetical protein